MGEESVVFSEVEQSNDQQSESDPQTAISELDVNKYFTHCNVLSKSVISEQRSLIKFLGEGWDELDYTRRNALLDLLSVEDDVRQVWGSLRKSSEPTQESFPRLYLNAGQKINVDFENDLWTWRDEHSGPFSWMSRSQQDLTLLDLEAENISKPQPKTLRLDTENQENLKEAEQQFLYPANCWSRDIIDNYRKTEKNIILTPCVSLEFSAPEKLGEEVNQAYDESCEKPATQPEPSERKESQDQINDATQKEKSSKERRKRSPSPKKMLRSSSFKRSPSKSSDQGEQQLISTRSDDSYEEQNTFSNPLVETQWSSFVGDNVRTDEEDIPMKNVCSIPTAQVMDRGMDAPRGSPYQVQNDNVQLITPSESPAMTTGKVYTMTNDLSGWSAESTPDHNTHLLKGMNGEKNKKCEPSYQFSSSALETYEKDEVLTVESQGTEISITTDSETKRDSNIPTTGFDFLDNW